MTESNHHVSIPPPPPLNAVSGGVDARKLVYNHLKTNNSALNDSSQVLTKQVRHLIKDDDECTVSYLAPVTPVLQDGPKCGLVALCMCAPMLGRRGGEEGLDVNTLYTKARERGFTRQGEMFSAQNMASLCELVGCHQAAVVQGDARRWQLIRAVRHGWPVLVPYDKDFNHEPCNQRGTKAHWALVAGLLLQISDTKSIPAEQALSQLKQDPEVPTLYHTYSCASLQASTNHLSGSQFDDVISHVITYQGKSLRPQVWKVDALLESNAQLTQLDPQIEENLSDYVIPENGIEGGLCNKIVVLNDSVKS